MRDPYEILGLAKTASAAEIKSAYRRLAKKFHPDQSKEPKAKDKFAEIGSAYEIVGDEKKREAFDRGEIDAEGKPRHPGFRGLCRRGAAGLAPAAAAMPAFSISISISAAANSIAARAGAGIDPDILAELFGAQAGGRARGAAARRGCRGHRDGSAGDGGGRRLGPRDFADRQDARCRHSRRRRGRQANPPARPGPARLEKRAGRRRAGHRSAMRRIRCSRSRGAICGSICRSRFTRPCSAARCARRRSTARSNSPFRRARAAGRILRLRGKGLPAAGEGAPGRSARDAAHRAADRQRSRTAGADAPLARRKALRSARGDVTGSGGGLSGRVDMEERVAKRLARSDDPAGQRRVQFEDHVDRRRYRQRAEQHRRHRRPYCAANSGRIPRKSSPAMTSSASATARKSVELAVSISRQRSSRVWVMRASSRSASLLVRFVGRLEAADRRRRRAQQRAQSPRLPCCRRPKLLRWVG